ncbi:uncharacterized protein N7500_003480 [Penicillium coprophilum]|uniref:uncharacterized protein n=1 Tax=Penicillium coprophilum TaxID=36646 RepID=UPI0023A0BD6E|nr:uncharacterized protein N7500_003480 [Penicillium coprophilum]KAJ5170697.1 hypothetical protein N7500_003480 [Penicillium coprophilum]
MSIISNHFIPNATVLLVVFERSHPATSITSTFVVLGCGSYARGSSISTNVCFMVDTARQNFIVDPTLAIEFYIDMGAMRTAILLELVSAFSEQSAIKLKLTRIVKLTSLKTTLRLKFKLPGQRGNFILTQCLVWFDY